jgi:hypothetical protein
VPLHESTPEQLLRCFLHETISYGVIYISRNIFAHNLDVVAQRHQGEESHPTLTLHAVLVEPCHGSRIVYS